jgi:hypothetical protein
MVVAAHNKVFILHLLPALRAFEAATITVIRQVDVIRAGLQQTVAVSASIRSPAPFVYSQTRMDE